MAGVKGRSGGVRPGSGRKPNEPVIVNVQSMLTTDPIKFLTALMSDAGTDIKVRADAAKALLPYLYPKKGEGGKKDARIEDAKKIAGKFTPSAPPRLIAAGGRKI